MKNPEQRREFWRSHVMRQKQSGRTRKAYCQSNDLNYDQFGYYVKQFSKEIELEPTLIPIDIESSPKSSPEQIIGIYLPNGIKVELYSSLTTELLSQLLGSC